MRDLVDIFAENEKNFYGSTIADRIRAEKKLQKEEEQQDKSYFLDVTEGALESSMFI